MCNTNFQDSPALNIVISHFTGYERTLREQNLNLQNQLHQQSLSQQQFQFQIMLSIMSQPQWALPSYGPQNVRPIRSQPYERSVQDQIPVLTSASHATTETASPKAGLFMHKWGTNLLSSAAPGPAETVASFSISFRIGRQPHVQEVREVRYPHFPNRSTSLWVLAPIYRIKFGLIDQLLGTESM